MSFSNKHLAEQAQKTSDDADYLAKLNKINTEKGVYKPLETNDADNKHLNQIKKKVNSIVAQELALLDYQDEQKQMALKDQTYSEVISKQNFYFAVDERKVGKNVRNYNNRPAGNPAVKPRYILPHEHVDIQNYIDLKGMDNEDKLFELYGYYSYLVDMHIAQIRPQNLVDKSYIPARFNQTETTSIADTHLNNRFFEYYHRWREPTRTWFSETQEIRYQEMLSKRRSTSHYNHDRGNKYEVETPNSEKFPHVADRLGYPEMREEPIERIVGLERAPVHPGYQFQPNVQTPSMEPDENLSFRAGETIYENPKLLEWVRLWKTLTVGTFGMMPGFYFYEFYSAEGFPSLSWMSDNWSWWQIPQQFQDGGDLEVESYRYCDDHDYMNIHYGAKRSIVRPVHTAYMLHVLILLQQANFDYVSRMVYNKDKDLVFVYKPNGLWNEQEYVYEMHHLEQMVPFAVTAIPNMSMQRDDGIVTVYDMNTRDNLKFYNEDKYWNMELKDEFMANTRGLWKGTFNDKYVGMHFSAGDSIADKDDALCQMKVDRELQDAIEIHGEVKLPTKYEDEWEARVEREKQKIVAQL